MTQEELNKLKARADTDDPIALLDYAKAIRELDPQLADKYTVLSAQLGNPEASEYVGDMFLAAGKYDKAAMCFKTGAKAGRLDCSVKLAAMHLATNESASVRELEELAEVGVRSACIALSEYYKSNGNRKQAAYWRSMLK